MTFQRGFFLSIPMLFVMGAVSVATADNLHVACVLPTTCSANPTDITLSNNPATFEIGLNGDLSGTGSGDFYLIALVPNNEAAGFSESISATNTGISPVAPIDAGAFTSGKLNDLLDNASNGFSGLGNGHPLSAYLSATQIAGVDPSATGYEVFTYNFGLVNLPTLPVFTTGISLVGTVFTSLMTTAGTKDVIFDSPNSEGLLVGSAVPEPRFNSLLLFAGIMMVALVYRRKSRSA